MKVFNFLINLYIGTMLSSVAYAVIFIAYKIATNSVGSF
jgi:hypothetical protein